MTELDRTLTVTIHVTPAEARILRTRNKLVFEPDAPITESAVLAPLLARVVAALPETIEIGDRFTITPARSATVFTVVDLWRDQAILVGDGSGNYHLVPVDSLTTRWTRR